MAREMLTIRLALALYKLPQAKLAFEDMEWNVASRGRTAA